MIFKDDYKISVLLVFLVSLGVSLYFVMYGWNGLINDYYGFRQAQTAISTFYMVRDGLSVDYITPVLGSPWSIPFEFPSYQMFVAMLVNVTDLPLDQAGRLVSAVSFYLCMIPIYSLSRLANLEKDKAIMLLVVFISSPLYIFWSRTFMIESMALLFSLLLINMGCYYLRTKRLEYIALALVFGLLSALTKVTTFFVASTLLTSLILFIWMRRSDRFSVEVVRNYVLLGLVSMGIPLLVSIYWNAHADGLKELNPLADFLLSENLTHWNFGTLDQRFSPAVWDHLLWRVSNAFGYSWNFNTLGLRLSLQDWSLFRTVIFVFSLLFLAWIFLSLFLSKKYRLLGSVLLLAFFSGPLVFINLYFEHEYYFYASSVYLLLALGLGLISIYERQPTLVIGLLLLFVAVRFDAYNVHYTPFIDHSVNYNDKALYQAINENVSEEEVFLSIGDTWSSEIPYYSERKAIMINVEQISNESFASSINLLGREKVTGVVFCGEKSGLDEQVLTTLIGDFSLQSKPVFENAHCGLYLRDFKNRTTSVMGQLFAASDVSPPYKRMLKPSRLFLHAPSRTGIPLVNVTKISVGYGLLKDAGDKIGGVCFEVSLVRDNIKTSLRQDCIYRSESTAEVLRFFEIELDSPVNGRLVLENSCNKNNCDWAWSYWDSLLLY